MSQPTPSVITTNPFKGLVTLDQLKPFIAPTEPDGYYTIGSLYETLVFFQNEFDGPPYHLVNALLCQLRFLFDDSAPDVASHIITLFVGIFRYVQTIAEQCGFDPDFPDVERLYDTITEFETSIRSRWYGPNLLKRLGA